MPKNIIFAASLPAPAERLWEMYLDPQQHSAFTGHPVTIAARAGAPFSAFDGRISGTILHVEPKKLIVQTWRSVHFTKDALDSVLVLSFWPESTQGAEHARPEQCHSEPCGRIELAHINVDDIDFAGVSQGWEKHYWTPWRNYLTRGSRS